MTGLELGETPAGKSSAALDDFSLAEATASPFIHIYPQVLHPQRTAGRGCPHEATWDLAFTQLPSPQTGTSLLVQSSCPVTESQPFEAGSGRDPLLFSVLLPQPPAFLSTATVTFLCPFSFSKATSPEAEEDLETMSPVILGTLLKHCLGLGTV